MGHKRLIGQCRPGASFALYIVGVCLNRIGTKGFLNTPAAVDRQGAAGQGPGFLVGGALGFIAGGLASNEGSIVVVASILGGCVGATLFVALYHLGIFFMGALLGALVGVLGMTTPTRPTSAAPVANMTLPSLPFRRAGRTANVPNAANANTANPYE